MLGFLVFLAGCAIQPPTPKLAPIIKISAKVYPVPEMFLQATEWVQISEDYLEDLSHLITPNEPCQQVINSKTGCNHVADVKAFHPDGSCTPLMVYWTGHNPAAISLDKRFYFYGGSQKAVDGASKVVELIYRSEHKAQKTNK